MENTATDSGTPLIRPKLPIFKPRPISEQLPQVDYSQFMFRQSFIQDYLVCPHYAMRRWIGKVEESRDTMAALLGTAGHKVVYLIHTERRKKADVDELWLMREFEKAFFEAIEESDAPPRPPAGFDNMSEALAAKMPFYTDIIRQYQIHEKNQGFQSTMHEQLFVLPIPNPDPSKPPYLFTGQIDLGGYDDDGSLVLRDFKFRHKSFRYSQRELAINIQITTYAAAMRYGIPSCTGCAPTYTDEIQEDGINIKRTLHYKGPCATCAAKMGTPAWPNKFPIRCFMVWMFDFKTADKDEFPMEILDPTLPKQRNPATNKMRIARVLNPKWVEGKKKGQPEGEGFLLTYRSPGQIQAFMEDILRICDDIRRGTMYRRPSDNCNYCSLYEDCKDTRSIAAQQHAEHIAKMYGASDPFGQDNT